MQLRPYQQEAIESIYTYFTEKQGNPVVALPTGTGKSLVIAGFIESVLKRWDSQRFMVLTHVKELIDQNAAKLAQLWPSAPYGIYSAGLKGRDTAMPIIFGGIGSVANAVGRFGHRDLVIIDEAHLLSPKDDTQYQRTIGELKLINPNLKVIGLTATPFRVGQGMITDGGLFTDICCDKTGVQEFNKFIADGYLAPLVPRPTRTEFDLTGIKRGADGDFAKGALQEATGKEEVMMRALAEMCEMGEDRSSWMVFAAGTENCEKAAAILTSFGIDAAAVHSKKPRTECDDLIRDYKSGKIRCIVGNNMLTTGFDHPPLDFIGVLRPTMSPGLWVQMLGRGTRMSLETGKANCLVADFAANTRRLGPINDPVIPRKRGKGGGDAPIRICPNCSTYNHASARHCTYCGEEFTFETRIMSFASNEELIKTDIPVYEFFDVQQVSYFLHEKHGSLPSIRVSYYCGRHKFDEWVHIERSDFLGKKARQWWRQRFPGHGVPDSTAEALRNIQSLRVPRKIKVHINTKFPEVMSYEY